MRFFTRRSHHNNWLAIPLLLGSLSFKQAVADDATILNPPLVFLTFNFDSKQRKIPCEVTQFSEGDLTIRVGSTDEFMVGWTDLTPQTAVITRFACMDILDTADILSAGQFAFDLGYTVDARKAFDRALELDPTLKTEIDKITAGKPGQGLKMHEPEGGTTRPATPRFRGIVGDEINGIAIPTPDTLKVNKFKQPTPSEIRAAAEAAVRLSKLLEKAGDVKFDLVDSDHFQIFTNWPKADQKLLQSKLEDAYKVITKQFDVAPKEYVFQGKMPVYAVVEQIPFQQMLAKIEGNKVDKNNLVYNMNSTVRQPNRLYLWRPGVEDLGAKDAATAMKIWQNNLIAGCTFNFLYRYRTDRQLPNWMFYGIARVVATSAYNDPNERANARVIADQYTDAQVSATFDKSEKFGGYMIIVSQTVIEFLASGNRKAFIQLVNDVKDGIEPEVALKKNFHADYTKLVKAWRDYAKKIPYPPDFFKGK